MKAFFVLHMGENDCVALVEGKCRTTLLSGLCLARVSSKSGIKTFFALRAYWGGLLLQQDCSNVKADSFPPVGCTQCLMGIPSFSVGERRERVGAALLQGLALRAST